MSKPYAWHRRQKRLLAVNMWAFVASILAIGYGLAAHNNPVAIAGFVGDAITFTLGIALAANGYRNV